MFFRQQRIELILAAIIVICAAGLAVAQDFGGTLGSSGAVFRRNRKPAARPSAKKPARKTPPVALKPQIAQNSRTNQTRKTFNPSRRAVAPSAAVIATVPRAASVKNNFNKPLEDAIAAGNAARDQHDFINAENHYKNARALNANDARPVYGLGNIYTDQQRWDDAEQSYRAALKLDSRQAAANIALSYVLLRPERGGDAADRFVEAETAARRAAQIEKQNSRAYDQLGVALEARGRIGAITENAYRRAVELEPNNALALAHLGRLMRKRGRLAESQQFYAAAERIAASPTMLILVAEVLHSENKFAESEPLLLKAVKLDRDNPTGLLMLGQAQAARNDWADAAKSLTRAAQINLHSFAALAALGKIYLRLGDYQKADRSLAQAILRGSDAQRRQLAGVGGLSDLGDAYSKIGQTENALRVYRQALMLDQDNREIKEKINAVAKNAPAKLR